MEDYLGALVSFGCIWVHDLPNVGIDKTPGNTEFSGFSSCLTRENIALEAGLFQPSSPLGLILIFPIIRTIGYRGIQGHFVE